MKHRVVFQVDQAESQDQELLRNQRECGTYSGLVRIVRLPNGRVSQIPLKVGVFLVKALGKDQSKPHG